MNLLCKQEFVQTIVIMAPWGSRPSCAGSFATLISGLVVCSGADGSGRSLRRLMNYDNVAPEGKSLLKYLQDSADTELGRYERRRWKEASDRQRLRLCVPLLSCPVISFSDTVLVISSFTNRLLGQKDKMHVRCPVYTHWKQIQRYLCQRDE